MKLLAATFISVIFSFSIAEGQSSFKQSLDTTELSGGCQLVIPKLCDLHDYWYLKSNCEMETFELKVFDRWGNSVFTADSLVENGFALPRGHSGKRSKKPKYSLPVGTYVWVINLKPDGGDEQMVKGSVTITQFME